MIEEDTGKLQVDALASRRGADQNAGAIRALEPALSGDLGSVVASLEYVHAGIRERIVDRGLQ